MNGHTGQVESIPERRYPRLASGVHVRCRRVGKSCETPESLNGIVHNFSYGGIFLATQVPFATGSVLELEFSIQEENPVSARAVVRWRQHLKQPAGIGLEFIEFAGIDDRDFASLITRILL